jgi:hypothetical protein
VIQRIGRSTQQALAIFLKSFNTIKVKQSTIDELFTKFPGRLHFSDGFEE